MRYQLGTISLLLLLRPLAAQGELSQVLSTLTGYQAHLLEARSGEGEGIPSIAGFSADVLEEAVVKHFSRWRLRTDPAGHTGQLIAFELLDPQGALALFSLTRQTAGNVTLVKEIDVAEVWRNEEVCFLWYRNFFFRVESSYATAYWGLIGQLIQRLTGDDVIPPPMTIAQLPLQDLVPESVRFYVGPAGLRHSQSFPLPLLDIVGFGQGLEVTQAVYQPGHALFLLGYPTASLAEEYAPRIRDGLRSFYSPQEFWLKRSGPLIGLFQGPEVEAARILGNLQYSATVKWLYRKHPDRTGRNRTEVVSFLGMVSDSIIAIGFSILIVLAVGLVAGGIRFKVLALPRFANRDPMIRLHLD